MAIFCAATTVLYVETGALPARRAAGGDPNVALRHLSRYPG